MRKRCVMPLVVLIVAAITLVGCGRSDSEQTGPTAIPIEDLTTPTRMAEQVMITPTLEPSPTEQVMATPTATTEPVEPTATAVPTAEPAATAEVTEATPEPTPEEIATPEPTPEPTAEPTAEPTPEPVTHTVQAGENLFRIGLTYGVAWQEIATANDLPASSRILVGQVLTIPVEPQAAEAAEVTIHIVQRGETLFRIGLQYNVPWDVIARANRIANPNAIYVGQELTIPGAGEAEAEPVAEDETETTATTHVVQPGETLFRIGLLYGMSWQVIAEANGITNPNLITVGTVLVIPEG